MKILNQLICTSLFSICIGSGELSYSGNCSIKSKDVSSDTPKPDPSNVNISPALTVMDIQALQAKVDLGSRYYYGNDDYEQDHKKAFQLYKEAALAGYAPAQFELGWCYRTGNGVKQDIMLAIDWFTAAAKQGYDKALYQLIGMS